MSSIPKQTQILVVGGGPSGSCSAGVLAREGFDVVLLESTKHPRYHIGESLLPSVRPHLRFFGVEEKVRDHGFTQKPGAVAHFVKDLPPAYTNFIEESKDNGVWNVERAQFDEILLRQARALGAKVFENVKVTELTFDKENPAKPVSATYTKKGDTTAQTITFDYLVDASGRFGLMSTKYLKNRRFLDSLKNYANWAYFEGQNAYAPGTDRENAPYFQSLADGTGWVWFIPLQGKVSVGLVQNEVAFKKIRKEFASTEEYYTAGLKGAPQVMELLGTATRIASEPLRSASDFSYDSDQKAGPNYRVVGDAACFIDPLFSSGVHMALTGGLSAATTIAASIRKNCTEEQAAKYHDKKVSTAFARFLIVVLGVYVQIKRQDVRVTATESYQPAIDMIKPVIQGKVDVRTGDGFKAKYQSTYAATEAPSYEKIVQSKTYSSLPVENEGYNLADKASNTPSYANNPSYASVPSSDYKSATQAATERYKTADDASKVPSYAQNPSYAAVPSSDYKVVTEGAREGYKVASEVSKAPSYAKDPSYASLPSSDYKLATEAAKEGYQAANAASEGYKLADKASKAPSYAQNPSYSSLPSSDYKLATQAASEGYKSANAASEGYKLADKASTAPSYAKNPSYASFPASDYKLATEAASEGYKSANAASEGYKLADKASTVPSYAQNPSYASLPASDYKLATEVATEGYKAANAASEGYKLADKASTAPSYSQHPTYASLPSSDYKLVTEAASEGYKLADKASTAPSYAQNPSYSSLPTANKGYEAITTVADKSPSSYDQSLKAGSPSYSSVTLVAENIPRSYDKAVQASYQTATEASKEAPSYSFYKTATEAMKEVPSYAQTGYASATDAAKGYQVAQSAKDAPSYSSYKDATEAVTEVPGYKKVNNSYGSVPAGPGYENYKLATDLAKPNPLSYSDAEKATYDTPRQFGYSDAPSYKDTGLDKQIAGSIGFSYSVFMDKKFSDDFGDKLKAEQEILGRLKQSIDDYVKDSIEGFSVRLQPGNLGLIPIVA